MSFFFSCLSFFFKLCERERGYIKLGIRRNGLKVYLSFFLWWSSCGEYFLFYGLIDFMLFLILACKKWLLRVRDIPRLLLPGVLGFGSVPYEPCPTTNFLTIYIRWREGVPTSVLGSQPIIWLLSSSFPCQATRVRSPSTCDPHSFLTVILWRLATVNSNTRIVVILFLSSQWETTWHYIKVGWDFNLPLHKKISLMLDLYLE